MTTTERETSGGSSGCCVAFVVSGSMRRTCPTASAPGHSWRATLSDTTATATLGAALALREASPAHEIDVVNAKVLRRDELVRDSRPASRRSAEAALGAVAPRRRRARPATPVTTPQPRRSTARSSALGECAPRFCSFRTRPRGHPPCGYRGRLSLPPTSCAGRRQRR